MAITIPTEQDAIHIIEALNQQIDKGEMVEQLIPLVNNIIAQYNKTCLDEDYKYALYDIITPPVKYLSLKK